jgi:hypothetical protein
MTTLQLDIGETSVNLWRATTMFLKRGWYEHIVTLMGAWRYVRSE